MSKIPELTEQFLAAADIEAETQIGIGPITHIPANDWAAIGARITTDAKNVSVNRRESGWSCVIICNDGELRSGNGETPLEALTAALDAAEGKSCPTNEPT